MDATNDITKKVGIAGRIASVSHFLYRQFVGNEKDANEAYRRAYPAIKPVIQSYGRKSKEADGLLNMLANLAPTGAKKRNFIKKYVSPTDGWLKLPKDPNDIPYGFWY